MCLQTNRWSTRNTQRIKLSQKSSAVKVYKLVRIHSDNTMTGIFYSATYELGKTIVSNRFKTVNGYSKLNDADLMYGIVRNGIHIFLTINNNKIEKAIEYITGPCEQNGPFALVECEAKREDLVCVGKWDHTGINCAVFTQVTPIKIIKTFTE